MNCRPLHHAALAAACAALALPPAASQSPAPADDGARADATERPSSPPVDAALSWADWSGDGLIDAWASQPDGTGVLLENLGDGTFADRTASGGLSDVAEVHQAAWSDVDGDGRLDLYLASWSGASRLFTQPAAGTFVDATRASGLSAHARPVHATWMDYDHDGAPDLHLVTLRGDVVYRGLGRARFERVELGLVPRAGHGGLVLPGAVGPDALAPGRPGSLGATGSGSSTAASSGGPGFNAVGTNAAAAGSTSGICAGSIEDQAGGGCLQASSVPALGMLYPLSNDFFIDATGQIGIGTMSPSTRLTVNGTVRASRLQSTVVPGTAPLIVNSTTRVDNLNADRLDGLDSTDFRSSATLIESADVANESLTGADILDGSIRSNDIGIGAVGTSEVADNSITTIDIANSTILTQDIFDGTIRSQDIADGTITSTDVADGGLTGLDIANGTISGFDIANNSIESIDIATGAITNAKIASDSVRGTNIIDGSITNADVNATAAIAGTKIDPDFGAQTVESASVDAERVLQVNTSAVRGSTSNLPRTAGYLGADGATDFDGVASADWNGFDIGTAGISTGGTTGDNYGVLGHSNGVGVRGEHSAAPLLDFGELGRPGVGLRARGTVNAGEFIGKVDITANSLGLDVDGGTTTGDAMRVTNASGGPAASFISQTVGATSTEPTITVNTQNRGPAVDMFQSNTLATNPAADVRSLATGSTHSALRAVKSGATAGSAGHFEVDSVSATGDAFIVRNRGTGSAIEATSASGVTVDANNTANSGNIIVARNSTDFEFRVSSSGDTFCDGAFNGGGADYAEWLPRLDPSETFRKGDVVGVHGGRISRELDGADSLLVISTNPCLVGNNVDAEEDAREGHEIVAFLGQVPVRVRGTVRSGDLLVPSGFDDGTAVAVAPEDLRPSQLGDVVGRAWADASGDGVHRVNAAIGLERDRVSALALEAVRAEIDDLRASMDAVLQRLEAIEQR